MINPLRWLGERLAQYKRDAPVRRAKHIQALKDKIEEEMLQAKLRQLKTKGVPGVSTRNKPKDEGFGGWITRNDTGVFDIDVQKPRNGVL